MKGEKKITFLNAWLGWWGSRGLAHGAETREQRK